jgi:drug/metabolite transporter (DMT)-like permease
LTSTSTRAGRSSSAAETAAGSLASKHAYPAAPEDRSAAAASLPTASFSTCSRLAALICKHKRPEGGWAAAAWAVAAGLTEAAALVAFARGGQAGQVAITAAVSSTYPVIPLAAGLLLFRERLSALQVFGICVAVTGLTLVSLSTRVA